MRRDAGPGHDQRSVRGRQTFDGVYARLARVLSRDLRELVVPPLRHERPSQHQVCDAAYEVGPYCLGGRELRTSLSTPALERILLTLSTS